MIDEARSRGIGLPKETMNLVKDKKKLKWPVATNGYFLKNDGGFYNPSPVHEAFIKSRARYVALYGPRGCGKALDISTPIPTPYGWKVMADIQVGDWVFDETGSPCKVTATSNVMFNHECYDVVFDDGSVITADAQHEWTTLTAYDRSNKDSIGKFRMKRGKIVPRTSPPWKYRTFTTHEIKNSLSWCERGDVNHSIDVSMPITLPDAELLVHPYVMGLWLGDGKSSGSSITIGDEDIENQTQILGNLGIVLRKQGKSIQYGMTVDGVSSSFRNSKGQMESNPLSLYGGLGYYGVLNNKHIPQDYLRASYSQRLELLQGLMDSDGHIKPDGHCEFCTTSRELAEGFYELCMTLGIKTSMKEGIVRFMGRDFERFRFLFTPYVPVFKLDRKLARIKVKGNQANRQSRRYIVDVREVPSVPVKCITVDSISHLYLAGASFIPTHNSGSGSQKAMFKIMQGEPGIIMNPDFENLKLSTWPEFKEWIPWNMVVPSQRNRRNAQWQPTQPFVMVFLNGAKVYIKGGKEGGSSRGPNVNWFWYDEAGRDDLGMAYHIANAGVRIGKDPQSWCTYTPRPLEHWTYKFFIQQELPPETLKEFEEISKGDRILIEWFHATREDNRPNLDPLFYVALSASYTSGHMRQQEFEGEYANEGGKIATRKWFEGGVDDISGEKVDYKKTIIPNPPSHVAKRVRFWDLAATEKKVVGVGKKKELNDPDETVGTLISKYKEEKETVFCIEHQVGGFWGWDALLEVIANTARHDGPSIPLVIEEEPGSGGKNQIAAVRTYFKKFPELQTIRIIGQKAKEVGDRVMAANHWFAHAAAGRMYMVKGDWNGKFLNQLDGFTQVAHDDRVTSVTGAMNHLSPFKMWSTTSFLSL